MSLNQWPIRDRSCRRNFDHIVSRYFAMCSHGSSKFSHLIISQTAFFTVNMNNIWWRFSVMERYIFLKIRVKLSRSSHYLLHGQFLSQKCQHRANLALEMQFGPNWNMTNPAFLILIFGRLLLYGLVLRLCFRLFTTFSVIVGSRFMKIWLPVYRLSSLT